MGKISSLGERTMAARWDGKIVLAAVIFGGYYALIFRISGTHPVPAQNAQMIRDGLLVLGPALGVIVGSLYRQTGSEERSNERRSEELKTAITTPSAPLALPPPAAIVADAVEDGARAGTRAGVEEALVPAPSARPPADEGKEIIQ